MSGNWIERTWSIALFGSFNPAITNLDWLGTHGALTISEVNESTSSTEGWATAINAGTLALEITLGRFLAQTTDGDQTARLSSLVRQVFSVLAHTPIHRVALGHDGEWSAGQPQSRDSVLIDFVSGGPTALIGPVLARSGTVRVQGLSGTKAVTHITMEDSQSAEYGLYVSIVDEIEVPGLESMAHAMAAVSLIEIHWPEFVKQSTKLADALARGVR